MKANFLQYLDEAILGKVERTLVWRVTRFGIGILPLLASLMFVIHIFLLIRGYDFGLAYVFCSYSFTGFLVWIAISVTFQFNWMHRAFSSYSYLVSFCVDFNREVGFGSWLMPARWFVFALGVLMLADFIWENGWKKIGKIN